MIASGHGSPSTFDGDGDNAESSFAPGTPVRGLGHMTLSRRVLLEVAGAIVSKSLVL